MREHFCKGNVLKNCVRLPAIFIDHSLVFLGFVTSFAIFQSFDSLLASFTLLLLKSMFSYFMFLVTLFHRALYLECRIDFSVTLLAFLIFPLVTSLSCMISLVCQRIKVENLSFIG